MFDNKYLPPSTTRIEPSTEGTLKAGLIPPQKVSLTEPSKTALNTFVTNINQNLKAHRTLALTGDKAFLAANNLGHFLLSRGYAVFNTSEIALRSDIFHQDSQVDPDYTVKTRIQGVHVLIVEGWLSGHQGQNQLNDSVAHWLEVRYKQPFSLTIFTGDWKDLKLLKHNSVTRYGSIMNRVFHNETVFIEAT